jgi:maltose-binding protein MalE
MSLIRFFLDAGVQRALFNESGWLPISLTALNDPTLESIAPHVPAVRQQMKFRIDSGFRPDYEAVTTVIGNAVRAALVDGVTPITALSNARGQIIRAGR